jgi:hypothetical protein
MEKQPIIEKSKTWVEKFVIGLQLCPFAKRPFEKGQVRFEVCFEKNTEAQLIAFWKEIELLSATPKETVSNIILILPNGLDDFEQYLDFYDLAEQLLFDQNKDEEFQLASFHPDYQFDGTEKDDVTNYTNRSPFPFIHILRIEEVEVAIANYPEIEEVPEKNIRLLKEIGIEQIKILIN